MTAQSRPLMWAEAIVAQADALEAAGVPREKAWCIAAGVERSVTKAKGGSRVIKWVLEQPGPVTSTDVASALGMQLRAAATALRSAERKGQLAMAGTVGDGHGRSILWKAP